MTVPPPYTSPTLDDVARAAGVSTATVSRCLNEVGKVSDSTRKRVMEAVERLGYMPNFGARALAAKRTYTIGAIIPTMENAIFALGLQAFQEGLHAKGYTLLVSSTGYQPEREAEQIKALIARGADGLLLIGYERDPELYEMLQTRHIPYLLTWAHQEGAGHTAIGFDNRGAMAQLTRELLAYGHRDFAIISAVMAGNDRAAERVAGIHRALGEQGISAGDVPLIETPYGTQTGGDAFETLMKNDKRPTMVMCVNDVLAAGAMQRARAIGMRVPDDISISGFDDLELARLMTPQLTTVHVPHRRMGAAAAEELVRMVETKAAGTSLRLAATVQMRDSVKKIG